VHRTYTRVWITTFIVLLAINIAVVVVWRLGGQAEPDGTPDDEALLDAKDETRLDWWPEIYRAEMISGPDEPVASQKAKPQRAGYISDDGGGDAKDYDGLMREYIRQLKLYLADYYRITPSKTERDEG
jgi:hypothetical protein